MRKSLVRNIKLAPSGQKKINWVKKNMPVLSLIEKEFNHDRLLSGIRIAMSIHLEAKTAYLAKVLKAAGAEAAVTGSNPLSTQDDVAAALSEDDIYVYAWHGATSEEYNKHLNSVLDIKPNIIIDDGGDLVQLLHSSRKELAVDIFGGCEETTTGVIRLRSREKANQLNFPMISVNDAKCKYLFDNRYGTGQSVWDGIMRTTNLIIAGKTVVVIGYGWCGKGVANKAKGLGANVIVCEVDPIKALEAYMDGFRVMPVIEASPIGDIFITVTGCSKALNRDNFMLMKNGVLLANAGHFDVEIWKPDLESIADDIKSVKDNIVSYVLNDGRIINLLGEGRLVNLAAGDGHPAEIMDMSFALQALCVKYINDNHKSLSNRVYDVPDEIDNKVAYMKLRGIGLEIDKLTNEQEEYLKGWGE
ncbi:MAG: adenosylhomocysteinase [Clostridiales bacterium]|nr:adenosylhomocysteinase [Clostridiales bacterium]